MNKVLLFLSMFLFVVSANAQKNKYSFQEQFNINQPTKLVVTASDANIKVIGTDDNAITVQYSVKKNGRLLDISKEAFLKEYEQWRIETAISDATFDLTLKEKWERNSWKDRKNQISVNILLYAPKETASKIKSSDGNISIKNMKLAQYCKTSDGDIFMEDIDADIDCRTSDGDIEVFQVKGDVIARTSDGDIDVKNISGAVNAKTSDGDITLRKVSGKITTKTSDGTVRNFGEK